MRQRIGGAASLVVMTMMLAGAGIATAADASLITTFASAFNSRGMLLTDQPVFEPSLEVSGSNGLALCVWGHMDLTDRMCSETDKNFSEIDLNVAYTYSWHGVDIEIGYYEYLYPHQVCIEEDHGVIVGARATDGSREVYAKMGYAIGVVTPSATVYYDFDEVDGFLAAVGVDAGHEFKDGVNLTFEGLLTLGDDAYNAFNFGVDRVAFNEGSATLGVEWQITANWAVSGSVQYMRLLDDDIRHAATAAYHNHDGGDVIGAIDVTYSF